jgi:hypothetical protein
MHPFDRHIRRPWNSVTAFTSIVVECRWVEHIETWFPALDQERFDGCTHVRSLASGINVLRPYERRWHVGCTKVSMYPITIGVEDDS